MKKIAENVLNDYIVATMLYKQSFHEVQKRIADNITKVKRFLFIRDAVFSIVQMRIVQKPLSGTAYIPSNSNEE